MPTTSQVSLARAWRAERNSAYVRQLLLQREPAFAAELAYAEQHFSCSACAACPNRPRRAGIADVMARGSQPTGLRRHVPVRERFL